MHRNSNITDNLNGTFHNAGILDFRHLQYADFQCLFSYKKALTFTGKEKDSETGFYYFGARYYDPTLSGLFLSVDPMSDKYPSISPYAYCAWNPVKIIDPNGEDTVVSINLNNGKTSYWYDDQSFNGTSVEIVSNNNIIDNYKCYGDVSIPSDKMATRTTLSFSEDKDAKFIFDILTGAYNQNYESGVEWDYYKLNDGGGDLVTSHCIDEINITGLSEKYNENSVKNYHHFHPNLAEYAYWAPSTQDQNYAMSLKVPCYLHFKGQSYRYDEVVKKYGVLSVFDFERHIPLTIFK